MSKRRNLMLVVVILTFLLFLASVQHSAAKPPAPGQPPQVCEAVEVLPAAAADLLGTALVPAATTENFEGTWPGTGWSLTDRSDTDGGEYLLGKRDCHPHNGSYSGWSVGGGAQGAALSCSSEYPNKAFTWAIYGPFSLVGVTSASFTFYLYGVGEGADGQGNCSYDYLFAGSSINGTNFSGLKHCSNWTQGTDGNGYYQRTIDLSSRLGQSQVWIGFCFRSDESYTYNGYHVDDVALSISGGPTNTPTRTPTPSQTATSTLEPSPALTPIATCAYSDDFSNLSSGWQVADNEKCLQEYAGGEYRILIKNANWWTGGTPGYRCTDCSIEVEGRFVSANYGSYGILFGLTDAWDAYLFQVSGTQDYSLNKLQGGQWQVLVPWTRSSAINAGQVTNRLRVVRNGPQISLYVNGQFLTTVSDSSFTGNLRVGLAASAYDQGNVDARFDSFCACLLGTPAVTGTPTLTSTPRPQAGLYLPLALRPLRQPTPTPTPWCDPYEPNDDRRVNPWGPLQSGQVYWAKLCRGDPQDNYYFDAATANPLQIRLQQPGALVNHTALWVYPADDLTHPLPNCGGGPLREGDYRCTCTLPRAGRYVVSFYSNGPSDDLNPYTLQVTFQ